MVIDETVFHGQDGLAGLPRHYPELDGPTLVVEYPVSTGAQEEGNVLVRPPAGVAYALAVPDPYVLAHPVEGGELLPKAVDRLTGLQEEGLHAVGAPGVRS